MSGVLTYIVVYSIYIYICIYIYVHNCKALGPLADSFFVDFVLQLVPEALYVMQHGD